MPLSPDVRKEVHQYCLKDLAGDLQWHIDQFSFIEDQELARRLGRAFYCARYIAKLMEALYVSGDEIHPFIKFQIMQYASIYEAVISYALWKKYNAHPDVKKLETHKAYKKISALSSLTSLTYQGENLYTCVLRDERTSRSSISFGDKVDCAKNIGLIDEKYVDDIKNIYSLRNLAHLENEAEKRTEVEIEQSKNGYRRIKPFLEKIRDELSALPA